MTTSNDLVRAVDKKMTAIRTSSLDFSFHELADMHQEDELIIRPDFQRMFRWSAGKQSRFIESLVLELPLPPIFLIERSDRIYELIDGLQRVSSYLSFIGKLTIDGELQPPLRLIDCDIVPELNGLTFAEIPRTLEIKVKRSYIRAEILRKESDSRLRYYMFKRLNTGGELLSEQEIRNATIRLLSNDFNEFLTKLVDNEDFSYLTSILTDNQKSRRVDQELVLRFFATKNDFEQYRHDVSDFLTDYMEGVSDSESDLSRSFEYPAERRNFERTFQILRRAADSVGIGTRAFGAVDQRSPEPKNQFSVYHYEGLVLGLQDWLDQIDPENPGQISAIGRVMREGKADPNFLRHTGSGKNDKVPFRARRDFFAERFGAALNASR